MTHPHRAPELPPVAPDRREAPTGGNGLVAGPAYPYFTSRMTLLILPVNRVSGPMPIPSATGV